VRQDLGVAVREPYGIDRFHPEWGTTLERMIGGVVDKATPSIVRAEVMRVIKNYIARQQYEMQQDRLAGRTSRYKSGEAIDSVSSVDVVQEFDRIYVRVVLEMASGATNTLTTTVA
jgi:phage baseplate assembly protein W